MKVGDLVKNYYGIGILVKKRHNHKYGTSWRVVYIDGLHSNEYEKDLEVISESR